MFTNGNTKMINKRHGRGKYTFANGDVYEGVYANDILLKTNDEITSIAELLNFTSSLFIYYNRPQ